jgi:hypothetical protein
MNTENKYQEKLNLLRNKYGKFIHDYPTYVKTNTYDIYDLYVELPPSHPYFTQDFPEIKKDFYIIDKFSKHYSSRAKSQFCKFFHDKGTESEAIEHLNLFASALKKIEIDNEILHKSKKAKYNENYFFK